MIVKKTLCDRCRKEICDNEPKMVIDGTIGFHNGSQCGKGGELKNHYCETCGRELLLAMETDAIAYKWIKEWTGKVNALYEGIV